MLPAANGAGRSKAEQQEQIFELSPSKQTSNDCISGGSQSCVIILLCVVWFGPALVSFVHFWTAACLSQLS